MSVNIEDLEVDFILQHFDLCLLVNKANEETECNLIEEEDSNELLENFIAANSQEGENLLAEIRDILPKGKQVIPSTNMITNMPTPDHLDKILCHMQFFFFKDQQKKDGSDFTPDTMSSFQKTPASHRESGFFTVLLVLTE